MPDHDTLTIQIEVSESLIRDGETPALITTLGEMAYSAGEKAMIERHLPRRVEVGRIAPGLKPSGSDDYPGAA